MATLISFMGGPNLTESRLDAMFIPGLQDGTVGQGNGAGTAIFNPGNEPSFGTPFLYNYLGKRQWKSVMRSREIVNEYYGNGRDGIPGNSDAGALESWMVWNLLGRHLFLWFEKSRLMCWGRSLSHCHATNLSPSFTVVQRSDNLG